MTRSQSPETNTNARPPSAMFMRIALVLMLAVSTLVNAAEPEAFDGRWKYNPDKSDMAQVTVAFTRHPSGEMRVAYDGQSYTVAVDGRPRPGLYGHTVAWRQVNSRTWEEVERTAGAITAVNTLVISEDGQELQYTSQERLPNGKPGGEQHVRFRRTAGVQGLEGKWHADKMTLNDGFDLIALSSDGPDAIVIESGGTHCRARFDGKPYPITGPTMAAGMTSTLTKTGSRSFTTMQAQNGKRIAVFAYELSTDGMVLTIRSEFGPSGSDPVKTSWVGDRVSAR
jgi:hypothetical protein